MAKIGPRGAPPAPRAALQNPSFYGWGALQAYLPEKDLAIAASATLEKEAKVGLNGGQMVFEEIAAALTPGHPPRP